MCVYIEVDFKLLSQIKLIMLLIEMNHFQTYFRVSEPLIKCSLNFFAFFDNTFKHTNIWFYILINYFFYIFHRPNIKMKAHIRYVNILFPLKAEYFWRFCLQRLETCIKIVKIHLKNKNTFF